MEGEAFPLWMIARSAVIGGVLGVLVLMPWRGERRRWAEAVLLGLVTGLSILLWRAGANAGVLNADPIPAVSPNDLACPVFTYVCLEVYAGLRRGVRGDRWAWERALLTLVSLVVNVVTI